MFSFSVQFNTDPLLAFVVTMEINYPVDWLCLAYLALGSFYWLVGGSIRCWSSLRAPAENGVTGEDGSGVPVFAEYNLDELRASTDGFATDHIVFEHCEKEPNTIYHGPSSALAPPSPSSSSTAPPGLKHANSWRRLGQLGCCRAFACPTSSDDATRVASGCSLLSSWRMIPWQLWFIVWLGFVKFTSSFIDDGSLVVLFCRELKKKLIPCFMRFMHLFPISLFQIMVMFTLECVICGRRVQSIWICNSCFDHEYSTFKINKSNNA